MNGGTVQDTDIPDMPRCPSGKVSLLRCSLDSSPTMAYSSGLPPRIVHSNIFLFGRELIIHKSHETLVSMLSNVETDCGKKK